MSTSPRPVSRGAELLNDVMKSRGLVQRDIENALEVTRGLVSRWLRGQRKPGRAFAMALDELYGISPAAWDEPPARVFVPIPSPVPIYCNPTTGPGA